MGRQSLLEFFRDYFDGPAEYLLYDDGYRRWTYSYRQIADAARAFASVLKDASVKKGDRILLWCENRPEWFIAFWGVLLAGAVVVPVGAESSFEFVRKVQDIVELKAIALGEEVSWDADGITCPVWRLTAENWKAAPQETVWPEIRAGDLAEIVFTSGSTGEPKGVEITHGNLLSQVEGVEPRLHAYRKYLGHKYLGHWFRPGLLELLPLSHMFGQVTALGLPPLISASIVITRRQSAAALLRLIRERRIAAAICVPRILDAWRNYVTARKPEVAGAAADHQWLVRRLWRYRRTHRMFGWHFFGFLSGGAPLDRELEDFWSGLGFFVMQGYGLTETSPVVTLNDPLRPRKGSVGRPLPGVDVKIADDGEILVRGPNVMRGYYRLPEATAEAIHDGWFYTGDRGRLDGDGYLYIEGRKKEVIVTSEGLNIFPEDVERVLDRIPGVRESAVFGFRPQGNGAGELVHAVAALEDGVDSAQVLADANQRLEAHQRIRDISVWRYGPLPRTPQTGKLRRGEIRDRVLSRMDARRGGTPARVAGECTPEFFEEAIEKRTRRKVASADRLDELGLSSIDRVELLLEFERLCGREIDEAELARSETVGQLREMLGRVLRGQSDAGVGSESGRSAFPTWNRNWISRIARNANLASWILPLTRLLTKPAVAGVESLNSLEPPVIFASNHQSHLDTPLILAALPKRWRYRIAPAMYKEYFDAYFHPRQHPVWRRIGIILQYYAVALFFNTFPIPQHEAGVLDAVRYAGDLVSDGWSLLIYPEGERRKGRQVGEFQPGVGLLAARLHAPVVPVHLEGVDHVLPRERIIPRPGHTRVTFGAPIVLHGENPWQLAHQVEETVQALE